MTALRATRAARGNDCLWLLPSLLALFLLGAACPACRTQPVSETPRIAPAASAALARAQVLLRERGDTARDAARAELARACELEPRWVAPQRVLDELAREELRGVDVLAVHRERLTHDADDPFELYLAGRLEGRAGAPRFERAVRVDPTFPWGWHGLSWAAQASGELDDALSHARRALGLARDPRERTFFSQNLARLLALLRRHGEAAEVLAERSAASELEPHERVALAVQGTLLALEASDLRLRGAAYERGLELLAQEPLSEGEVRDLVGRLRETPTVEDPEGHRLLLALSACSSPARDRLRAELLLDATPTPLALGLLERSAREENLDLPAGALLRAARFWSRQYGSAIERWLAELPKVVLDEHSLPRDPALTEVVQTARALQQLDESAAPRGPLLTAFGESLIGAGWFREARAVSAELAEHDLPAALALDARALAGIQLIQGVGQRLRRIDFEALFGTRRSGGTPHERAWRALLGDGSERRAARDLDELLESLAPLFARAHGFLGGSTDAIVVKHELSASPRLSYAPIGELVHPGPTFSAGDESDGLGRAGEPVSGLAAELARLGRFALLGELAGGGGPDATLLPRLFVEQRSGEHLGVAWSGTVAWCEAAEIKSRAARAGARISAAAVHEGYWLDIDAVRDESEHWRALARGFDGPGARAKVREVLDERGLALANGASDPERRSRERRSSQALLGEAQRVRLAVLAERGGPDGKAGESGRLGEVSLDELVAVTATHEEGHLCDRTRFLPLTKRFAAAFAFALECGFSPQRVQEMLEYRAQLTALCDAADPRIPLAQVLDAAESVAGSITPHAAGYARLLDDLLGVLDDAIERDASAYPALDRGRTLVHQLHWLGAEEVRQLSRALAHKKRMTR